MTNHLHLLSDEELLRHEYMRRDPLVTTPLEIELSQRLEECAKWTEVMAEHGIDDEEGLTAAMETLKAFEDYSKDDAKLLSELKLEDIDLDQLKVLLKMRAVLEHYNITEPDELGRLLNRADHVNQVTDTVSELLERLNNLNLETQP